MQKTFQGILSGQVGGIQKGGVASKGVSNRRPIQVLLATLRKIKQAIHSTMKFLKTLYRKISRAIRWREHTTIKIYTE